MTILGELTKRSVHIEFRPFQLSFMSKHVPNRIQPARNASNGAEPAAGQAVPENLAQKSSFDSPVVRWIVSGVLVSYLLIVLLGPLSNPVGSEFLTRPMARFVAPVHRALFLGHGYRFFGPDPGPSHLVVYRITDHQGNQIERHFPDRTEIWPRLLYHRWFMLSETVYQEHASTPNEKSYLETAQEFDKQIQALRFNGRSALARRMTEESQRLERQYANSRKRIDGLVTGIAKQLLATHEGQQIELFVQERNIPFPVSVLTGEKLTDPKFLSPLIKIGEFRLTQDGNVESLETVPEKPGAKQ